MGRSRGVSIFNGSLIMWFGAEAGAEKRSVRRVGAGCVNSRETGRKFDMAVVRLMR